jgi:hypothetical protein
MANDEEVPDRVGPVRNKGKSKASLSEIFQIKSGDLLAPKIPFVEMGELHSQEGCL